MSWITQNVLDISIIAAGAIAGLILYGALFGLVKAGKKQAWYTAAQHFFKRCFRGLRIFLPLLGIYIALPMALEGDLLDHTRTGVRILLIVSFAYLLIRVIYGAEDFLNARLGLDKPDNLEARTRQTQLRVLRNVLVSSIAFAAIIFLLLYLPGFKQLGTTLLASAGIAGLVIGFAAQRALANLLAGFQIAVTQPIRLDDVVVVEDEWGRIEEITLTYVVVRIWDDRRLILPISYFLEKPFRNWTRQSADILGTIYLYTDYTAPIDELRQELDRILAKSEHWDGRVSGLVVTDCKEQTLELRALISARDGGNAWDLRCEVREGLVRFLQENHPDTLPRVRAEIYSDRENVV